MQCKSIAALITRPRRLSNEDKSRVGYGAESRRKVLSSRLGSAMRPLETLSVDPAVNANDKIFMLIEQWSTASSARKTKAVFLV